MKACPVQRYGMQPVMEHYVETGEVLGKGTENLEGYTLSDQGHFGAGELPVFDAKFFDMPQGRSEDWLLLDFRNQLLQIEGDTSANRDELWTEFRDKVEGSLAQRSTSVDMGMDRGI